MSAAPTNPNDNARQTRLRSHFDHVLKGKKLVRSPRDGELFIESICAQPDVPTCITELISYPCGLSLVQESMRFKTDAAFLNGPASSLLGYIQAPPLKAICEGDFLRKVILHIVEPPFFWNAFVHAFRDGRLEPQAKQAFGWLLLELICFPADKAVQYQELARDVTILTPLLKSPQPEISVFGQRIKLLMSNIASPGISDSYGRGPGGRHDNDFVDFRDISILPTAGELMSQEAPFLRLATAVEEAESDDVRLAIHLDNQFRLLREDMVGEMREELHIALDIGRKGKKSRNIVVDGFKVAGIYCGPDDVPPSKLQPWCLRLKCNADLPQLAKLKDKKRADYIKRNRNFFKHLSLACLLVDGEIVAFPTIMRDEGLLAQQPPVLLLRCAGKVSTPKALLKLKQAKHIRLVQINTAVFSYEPVLLRLQDIKMLELRDELLLWKEGIPVMQPPSPPLDVIRAIKANPSQDLRVLLGLKNAKPVKLDSSQSTSLLMGLSQRVSLIQGPPGTGKSFIGALLAKILHDSLGSRTILVVTYTNHALDTFLEDLLDIGIPAESMVRLGGKSTPRTKPLSLWEQSGPLKSLTKDTWKILNGLETEAARLAERLEEEFVRYANSYIGKAQVMEHLEFASEGPDFHEAFSVPEPTGQGGWDMVGGRGRRVDKFYLLDRWVRGNNPGVLTNLVSQRASGEVWGMPPAERLAAYSKWHEELLREMAEDVYIIAQEYNDCLQRSDTIRREKNARVMREKRIVGCTTTAAAKYFQEIQAASADVLLIEEAGELLESHVLTALGSKTEQLILIGDHKQLRPKVANYNLTVEKGQGYDLNRSLFERLVLKGFPHQTLSMQHRMRPEISELVRQLTYPDLVDAESTKGRPDIRGFQDNLIFVSHTSPEDKNSAQGKQTVKSNKFEAEMVLKCVRYLGQQGYGTSKIVVLTPYLGQLHLLQDVLSKENDPILNDLDSFDLVRAGLLPAANAKLGKNPIRISSIDNYQGEESDIVIVTMTRSNAEREIGFMSAPERLNVLLSRARNGLIMIGDAENFINARRGKEIWVRFFELLRRDGHVYEGFPVQCQQHPDRKAILRNTGDFEVDCPDGGCKEPCGTILSCDIHMCPQRCHQLSDHSKMPCERLMEAKCPVGHQQKWKCHQKAPLSCMKCEVDAIKAEYERKRVYELQQKREAEQKEHIKQIALLDEKIEKERQKLKDEIDRRARAMAINQKLKDLRGAAAAAADAADAAAAADAADADAADADAAAAATAATATVPNVHQPPSSPPDSPRQPRRVIRKPVPSSANHPSQPSTTKISGKSAPPEDKNVALPEKSQSEKEWERQKDMEGASNDAIDSIMGLIGLENVKSQVLMIKAKIDVAIRQGSDIKDERFGVVLLGNPGTGKTTVARQYANFLATYQGILPGTEFVETTGSRLANDGVAGAKKLIEQIQTAGGGAFFLDEAYQLTEGHNFGGAQVLDFLLAEIENNIGKIVFILAGYNKQMEKFFEHNPGLPSRIPYTLKFEDYTDSELHLMLRKLIDKKFKGKMEVEGGMGGLYMRIAVRRLGRGRGREGFGNMRDLQVLSAKIMGRQGERINRERRDGLDPDDFYLIKEDLIGPDPSEAILESSSWKKLQELIGLDTVKQSVSALFELIETNYRRELNEKEPMQVSLNRVFLGSPGTGKTSVAKLYGRILADLGLLSNGEVVTKNPSDFVGDAMGVSESNTKGILASTLGKVLIIDEAYMLYSGGNGVGKQSDPYRTAVIDTIVAEVQSTIGEDRCVLLLGYEEQMVEMFHNVNPGLSRRFAIEDAFHFQDFTNSQLRQILELKLKHQELDATEEAKSVACELLGRARMRPNFGNAGEVENRISKAKTKYQQRQSQKPVSERSIDVVFEPQDFDPDFDRGTNAALNCKKLFEDVVGCEEIVSQLEGYQQIALNAKAHGLELHELIPTNFVFKGPPGTGKTTTARKMGQVYYDMGFLSSADVVECSASDLIGEFVGQTGPKAQKQLEKGLGKVLFIDEAYRLGEGHFATEAVNELVDLLTKPKFAGKIVVILAGYDNDMNKLMTVNSGLSSRFPEEVIFRNMAPHNCLELLSQELTKKSVIVECLGDVQSDVYIEMLGLVEKLSALPSWGNARDIKNLAKTMIGISLKAKHTTAGLSLSSREAIVCINSLLVDRQARGNIAPPQALPSMDPLLQVRAPPPNQPRAPPVTTTRTKKAVKKAPPKPKEAPISSPLPSNIGRDAGVSDAVWNQLQADKKAEELLLERAQEVIRRHNRELAELKAKEEAEKKKREQLARIKAKDDSEMQELKRRREKARLAEQRLRIARQKALDELERLKEIEARRRQEEVKVQAKLREMGVCVAGFRWIKQAGGYACAGGAHFVTDKQLGI